MQKYRISLTRPRRVDFIISNTYHMAFTRCDINVLLIIYDCQQFLVNFRIYDCNTLCIVFGLFFSYVYGLNTPKCSVGYNGTRVKKTISILYRYPTQSKIRSLGEVTSSELCTINFV